LIYILTFLVQKNWNPQLTDALISVDAPSRFIKYKGLPAGYYGLGTQETPLALMKEAPVVAYRVSSSGQLTAFSKARAGGVFAAESLPEVTLDGDVSASVGGVDSLSKVKYRGLRFRDTSYTCFDFELANPFGETVRILKSLSDPSIILGNGGLSVRSDGGYRLAKCSHGVSVGRWYFEAKLVVGHCRVGWSAILADSHAPLGYDEYGYAYGSKSGNTFHCRIPRQYGPPCAPDDVIGCLIELPEKPVEPYDPAECETERSRHASLATAIRNIYPPLSRPTTLSAEFRVSLPVLVNARIQYFINGCPLGVAFKHIYHAKYRPAISLYHGIACLNMGPNFKFPPPNELESENSKNNGSLSSQTTEISHISGSLSERATAPSPLTVSSDDTLEALYPVELPASGDLPPTFHPMTAAANMPDACAAFDLSANLTYFEQQEKRRQMQYDPSYRHPMDIAREQEVIAEKEREHKLKESERKLGEKMAREKEERRAKKSLKSLGQPQDANGHSEPSEKASRNNPNCKNPSMETRKLEILSLDNSEIQKIVATHEDHPSKLQKLENQSIANCVVENFIGCGHHTMENEIFHDTVLKKHISETGLDFSVSSSEENAHNGANLPLDTPTPVPTANLFQLDMTPIDVLTEESPPSSPKIDITSDSYLSTQYLIDVDN
jgi:hypothetical protein